MSNSVSRCAASTGACEARAPPRRRTRGEPRSWTRKVSSVVVVVLVTSRASRSGRRQISTPGPPLPCWRDPDAAVDVEAVRAHGRRRSHRSDQDHGFAALHDQVQEIGRLLEGVGTVRDHDAVDVRLREQGVDALGELQPDVVRHAFACDLRDLFAAHVGQFLQVRLGIDQLLDRHLRGGVAGVCVADAAVPAMRRRSRG